MATSMDTLQVLEGIGERIGRRGGGRDDGKLLRRTISEGDFTRGAVGNYNSQKIRKKELMGSDEALTNSKARKGEQLVGTLVEKINKDISRDVEMEDNNLGNDRMSEEQNNVNDNSRRVEKVEGLPYQPLMGQEGEKGLLRQGSIASTLKELEMASCDGVVAVIIPCHQLTEIMPVLPSRVLLTAAETKEEEEEEVRRRQSWNAPVGEGIACSGGREEGLPHQRWGLGGEAGWEEEAPRGKEELELQAKKKAGVTAPRQLEAGCNTRSKLRKKERRQQQQQRSPCQQQQKMVPSQHQAAAATRGGAGGGQAGQLQVKVVECECCGLSEECTEAYIEKVRGTYCGRWVCGLCAAAVSEERRRLGGRGSPMRDALRAHLDVCARFSSSSPPPDLAVPAALCHVLRRHLSEPPTPTPTPTPISTPSSSSSRTSSSTSPSLTRSSSCLPSFSSSSSSNATTHTTSDHSVPILSLPPFARRVPRA